jgi:3-hydroxyisobutyrate dehydrogenase-like beta-hydroxyacid dehydrogenase
MGMGSTKPTVAFLGLGAMGGPMAERLVLGGYTLRVFDVARAAVGRLVALGAEGHASPKAAATGASIVLACLPSPDISLEVALGKDGVASATGVEIYVEMSTIGSATVERIASELGGQGIAVIDAPVSGGPRGARAGTLSLMAAGDAAAFEAARPVFDAITHNIFHVGDKPGLGQITKLANNMISAAGMAAAFEATALAVKAGVDARTLIDVINASTGRNSATADKFPASVLPRTFDYGGKLSTMYKDVFLCCEEARRRNVPMWVGSSVVQLWFHAMTQGRGNDDYTTLIKMIEDWAGVVVGDPPAREA